MNDEVFDALDRWAALGYAPVLAYGPYWNGEHYRVGWTCYIHLLQVGTATYGREDTPLMYHPTSAHEAARQALREAAKRWPEMAERAQP